MRASLIVLNYRGTDVLAKCVASMLSAIGPDDEIIVVDNACPEQSWRELPSHPQVRLIRRSENNYIFGLNDGVAASQAEFVAFCNNDMVVEGDFVEGCLAGFDGPAVFAVCPRILDAHGGEQGALTSGYWHRGLIFYKSLPHDPRAATTFFAVGGQSFFRRQSLLALGSIDELLWPMYHEDIELSYRAWRAGYVIRYAPSTVVHHVGGHSSSKTFTPRQLRSFVRQNEFLIVWKNVADRKLLMAHLMWIPVRVLAALLKRDTATLIGFARAASRLPRALAARRQSLAGATVSDVDVLALVAAPRVR